MKRLSIFMLLLALIAPWAANAQETLPVYANETTEHSNVPVWGLWADNSLQCEIVYPASELEDMAGGEITALKFFTNSTSTNIGTASASDNWDGTFTIFMKEVEATTLSAFTGTTGATTVLEGQKIGVVNGEMTIEFTNTYTYGGGNLLVGVYYTTGGHYKSVTWHGKSVTGASIYGRSGQSYSPTQGSFIPKTTFTYTPGSTTATAPGVTTSETVANLTNTSVTLGGTITDMGGATGVFAGICYGTTSTPTTSDGHAHSRHTSAEAYTQDITGLLPNTTYYYRAYAYNSANSLEDPTYGDIYSFTTACNITLDQPANGAISASVAGGAATTSSTYALPGQSVSLTATAVSGYDFDSWIVSGVTGTAHGNTYTFTMPHNDVTATASIVPTSGGTSTTIDWNLWERATSISTSETYLIGLESGSDIYLVLNYNPSNSSYYYNNSSTYLGYTALATIDGNGYVTGCTGNATDLQYAQWKFSSTTGGTITSVYQSNRYLYGYTSTSYGDCYPNTTATTWTYSNNYLTYTINSATQYLHLKTVSNNYYIERSTSGTTVYLYKPATVTTYAITATASPSESGTVAGSDYYAIGSTCTLTATPGFGYDFVSWTENGTVVSTDAEYTFTVSSARTLVANFESQGSCIKPTDVAQVTNTEAAHQAQLSWTENNEATQWEVVFSTDSEFDPDAATPITVNDNPTVTIPSLAQETTYYVYVRAICGENSQSGWSNKATFTTISGRQAPTVSYDESTLTDNSVTITWTGVATNVNHQSYDLYYSTDPVMPQTPVQSSFIGNINAESKELTDLTSQTTYYVWVRDNCGTDGYSDWSEAFSFRTACGVISSFPWSENFNGYEYTGNNSISAPSTYPNDPLPDCWNFINRSETTSTYPQAHICNSTDYAVSGNCLFFRSSSSTPLYAVLPAFSNDISGLELSFIYRNEGTGTSNGTLYVSYMTDPNDASTFNTENAVACAQTSTKTSMAVVLPNAPAGSYFAFKYQGGTSNNYYLAIDNITVKVPVFVTADQIVNTVSDPATEMTWNEFVNYWTNGDHFTSSTFTLMDNITVSTMVGTSTNPFTGTFDGNSHTITVNLTATAADFTAPFRIIRNATIQNLKVDGTINDGGFKFCAGFAGDCYGNNIFTNCESAVTINATIEGDGTHGGFIARNYGSTSSSNLCTTVFNGCAFTGQLLGANTNQVGGFCGWSEYNSPNYAKTIFNNCVFAPQAVTMSTTNSAAFARRRNASYVNFNNCYFMQDFNDGTNNTAQGKQAYTITGVSPVNVAMSGTATEYSVSGITAYSDNSGLLYNGTIYAGGNEIVNLTLSGSTTGGYQASEGVLERAGDNYNILMDANDTEISVDPCPQITGLTVSNITAKDAKVSWDKMATQATGDITYQVIWAEAGQDPDWTSPHVVSVFDRYTNEHAPYCTASNYLESETEYVFYVRRKISQNEYCDAVATETFTTLSNCSAPAELNATSITANSATLSWSGAQESYNVRYRKLVAGEEVTTTEDFSGQDIAAYTSTGELPDGWHSYTTQSYTPHVCNSSSYSYISNLDGNYLLMTTNSSNTASVYAIMPKYDNLTAVSFNYAFESTSSCGTLEVGYVTDNTGYGTFQRLGDAIAPAEGWGANPYTLSSSDINTINANGGYVAFKYNSNSTTYYSAAIDNVVVTTQSITPDAWNTDNTNVTSPLPISGLEMNTTYQWQVQGINSSCTGGLTDWSEMATFNTPYPTFTKTIEAVGDENWENGKGGYYLIASPLAEDVTPNADNGFIVGDYDLYMFDQAEENEWVNYKDNENGGGFSIVNGQGYLYASKEGTVLTFTGAPGTNGEVTLHKTAEATGLDFPDWNLVGNPFGENAYLSDGRSFYSMQNTDDFIPETGNVIGAMEGVFVVAGDEGETLTFTTTAKNKVSKLNLNLTKGASTGSATLIDRAIVRFDEGGQLPKLQFRNGSTKVYIPQEGKDYAVVSSESMGTMSVNFKAENNGTYTFSFTSEEVSFAYLHLIDNMTGIETDLLANPSYSFEARTTDYESRFKLVFATGNNSNDDNFAFYSNGSFVINNEGEATLQVIDVNGRILKNESINGCANVNVKAAAGVYVLRLVNGNDVKVQKVVVR